LGPPLLAVWRLSLAASWRRTRKASLLSPPPKTESLEPSNNGLSGLFLAGQTRYGLALGFLRPYIFEIIVFVFMFFMFFIFFM
jgi:hypothetical protein